MDGACLHFVAMADFPNRINQLRRARGLSQQQLADRCNCSKMQISGLERGSPELTISWMRRVAKALDVSPADLLLDEDNPERLNDDERQFVGNYRRADPPTRDNLGRVADALVGFRGSPPEGANDQERKAG